ncbi:MAG: hydrophobe/amphiphile efflux-3 (HAE3) family transporter [Methanomicrobiales archaeon]|nr:hydrophobe/amphiphile efflux-3 (HAE3) family transporter [Methanomicrobiales archaeon]
MHSFFDYIAAAINRRPLLVAGAIAGLLIVALIGASLTTMETGMSTYVDENTERGMLLQKYVNNFQSDNIIVLIEADNAFTPDVLAYVDRLEGELADERYVTGVTGITDLLKQANGGILPTSYAEIDQAKARIPAEVLSGMSPSPTMMLSIIGVEPGVPQDSTFSMLDSMNARIGISSPPPGVVVTLTGESAFGQQMMNEMSVSMSTLLLAAMILMVIAVGIFFGHVRYRLLSVFIVGAGVLLTFGIMGLLGIKISMVVIGAFPVLIGIGIDYAIQFHSRFDEEARKSSLPDAVRNTVTNAGPSVLYAMLATCMGFLALWIAPIPMIQGFGIVCVIGLISCYLAALVIVPTAGVLLRYRPLQKSTDAQKKGGMMERYNSRVGSLAGKVAANPVPVILLCALIAVVGIQLDNQIIINTDEKTFVPSDMPAKIQLDKVTRAMGPSGGVPIFVQGDGILTVDGLTWMQDFQEYEETHNSKVTGSRSIVDVVKEYNGGSIPDTNYEIERVLGLIPEEVKKRYLSGNSLAVIEISMIQMENNAAMAALDGIQRDISWNEPPPGITAHITGMGEMFTNLIREISSGKLLMTLLALGLILTFLYLIYRRLGRAITPVVPIVLIVGWNGLIMYVLGIDYTPMTATLGSMTIGVASEYTILIMERAFEERKRGATLIPAIQQAVSQIGTAITVSGLTTVFGFAALTLSAFNMISNFGTVTVITVAFTLIGAIVVMPAILSLVGAYEDRKGLKYPTAEEATA